MNRRRITRELLLLLLVTTFAGATTPATGQELLQVIGPRALTIPAEGATSTHAQLPDIAVRYDPADPAWAPNLSVVSVVQGGRAREATAFGFSLERNDVGEPVLRVTVDLTTAREAGDYAVTVAITHEGPGAPEPQLEDFTFTRPAAQLRIGTPIRLDRVITNPWGQVPLAPRELLLGEVGGRAAYIPAQQTWLAELRNAENRPVEGRLRITFPAGIDAWEQATAALAIEGPLPLGTVTGTVTVRSHQLAERALDFTVEVDSRLHWLWLVAVIVAGILLGWLARVGLEGRRQRTRARAAAEEQRGKLLSLIDETVDPDLSEDLQQILRDLATALASPLADADSMTRAAREAEEKTEHRLKVADKERDALAEKITVWRMALGTTEGQPPKIAELLEATLEHLAGQEHDLTRGSIRPVTNALDDEERKLPARLDDRVRGWFTEVSSSIARMGHWPGTSFEQTALEIEAEIEAIGKEMGTPPSAEPDQIRRLLNRTRVLGQKVRHDLLGSGLQAVEWLADKVLQTLANQGLGPLEEQLRKALGAFKKRPLEPEPSELPHLSQDVHVLRLAVEAARSALEERAPNGDDGDSGDEPQAVIAPHSRHDITALVDEPTARTGVRPAHRHPEAESRWRADELGAPAWALRITTTPSSPSAGEPILLQARVVAPEEATAPIVSIAWEVAGQLSAEGLPAHRVHKVTPRRSGPLVVRATATDSTSGSRAAAEIVLQIRPPQGHVAVSHLSKRVRLYDRLQTVIFAALIVFAGFVIFEGAFIGTPGDLFAAFLWGFTVDIGIDRIRELAAPIAGQTLPVPPRRAR